MRILFVSTHLPIPPNNGQAIRTLSIVEGLASNRHQVTFLSFGANLPAAALAPLASLCREVVLVERSHRMTNMSEHADYVGRLLCLFSCRPYSIRRFRSQRMQAKINECLQTRPFDLVVCDSVFALCNMPKTAIPIALNCHNVEHVILERYAQIERNPLRRWYARLEAGLVKRTEHDSLRRATFAMACSATDRRLLAQICSGARIFVVPNTVNADPCDLPSAPPGANDQPVVLFQGGMDWFPNRDAVEFFAERILPVVRSECADVKFVVAGRNPAVHFVERFRGHAPVEFTGTVPDMRPYLAAATVVVVPLRLGSGTRFKILEACAARKAVVSTSIGAEGLALEHGKQIVLADSPDEFGRAVVHLIQDASQREAIANAARMLVVEQYSQSALRKSLADIPSFREPVPIDRNTTRPCLQELS
jgi:glycosyltransferase involved in cell wall biosynthesis